jgi:hypothetical protein
MHTFNKIQHFLEQMATKSCHNVEAVKPCWLSYCRQMNNRINQSSTKMKIIFSQLTTEIKHTKLQIKKDIA